jgi:hypothetical protein
MRQINRLSAIVAVALLMMGLGVVASNGHVARAVTTISQLGLDLDGEAANDQSGYSVAMSADGNRIAIGARYNDGSGNNAGHVRVYTLANGTWTQTGSDINGEAAGDNSGWSVAMSADGNRIAIGAPYNDGSAADAGHVRVYSWNGTAWTQTGADINGETGIDWSGYSVAMSSDGNRIAIGASMNDSSGGDAGHVRVYSWNGTTWTQTGSDIDGEAASDNSGSSVAMSADGNRIAIGAQRNDGSGNMAGHVRVYSWNGTAWTQTGADIDGEAAEDQSGFSVAMSSDGNRIAIGAILNDGNGITAGHVRIYTLANGTWTQTGSDIDGEDAGDYSSYSLDMSADGNHIVIGAISADHARVFSLVNGAWLQTGSDIDGEAAGDNSGFSVAMSASGTRIAVGAMLNDNSYANAGHVRVHVVLNTPAAPTISSIAAANGSLSVAFTPGANDGSPITNYKYSIDGTNFVALNPATTTSPFFINGLTNGATYSVTIKAVNTDGDSPTSNAVTGTPTAPTSTTVAPTSTIKVVNTDGDSPTSNAVTGTPTAPTSTTFAPTPTTVAPTSTTFAPTPALVPIAKTASLKTGATSSLSRLMSASNISLSQTSNILGSVTRPLTSVCKTSGIKVTGVAPGKCIVKIKITPKKGTATTVSMPLNIVGSPSVKRGASITLTNAAAAAGLTTGNEISVDANVATSSSRLCKVSRTKIMAALVGRCSVTVTVTSRSGATSTKQLTINVK